MRDHLAGSDIEAQVALVTFSPAELLDEYQERHRFDFPVLVDLDREVYRAYGFGRGSLGTVWGPKTLRRYVGIIRQPGRSVSEARRSGGTKEDTRQLGGDMVIASDGTLAWGFWGSGPADRPEPDELVEALAASGRR